MSCNLIEVEVLESGIQGLSAYEVYVQNGGELSEEEWLESLKGQDGADGYTPVKGTDYWNEDDVNEIKSYVDEQVGNIDLSSYATKDEIPDISNLAEKSEIPDISNLASKDEIPDVSDFITNDVDNLSNYELKSNTGSSLELNIDNSTYIMTINLKNSDGTVLSSETVDLPLETMVINANYDNATKEIVLTLKSGTTTRFSVADLVSGLVNTDDLNVLLATKQDVLTAGTNISIENGEISATDTTYDVATVENDGLMSSADKEKLDGIDINSSLDKFLHVMKPVEGTDYVAINDGNVIAGLFYLVPVGYRVGFIDSNGDFKPFYMQGKDGEPYYYDEINGDRSGYGLYSIKIMCFSSTTNFADISSGQVYIKVFTLKASPSYGSSVFTERSLCKYIRDGRPTDGYLSSLGSAFPNGSYALSGNVLTKDNLTAFTPTNNYHPATKKYVDDKYSSIDLSSYATTEYVDNAITSAISDAIGGEY